MDTLARRTADALVAAGQPGVVVGAISGEDTAIAGAGTAGTAGARAGAGNSGVEGGTDGNGPPGPRTMFEIGSVTKTFTSLVLLSRVRAGAVALDQPVRELLPEGTRVPELNGRAITLVDLATHTSGLPRLPPRMTQWPKLFRRDPYARYTPDRLLGELAKTRLLSIPGEQVLYSNLGVALLGTALAHHAGTDYATLVTREVIEPLGLTDTVLTLDRDQAARMAQGYVEAGKPTPPWTFDAFAGAGGLRSTAVDMIAFVRAHLGDGPAAGALRESCAVRRPISEGTWMQPGWVTVREEDPIHLHDGGTGGFVSLIGLMPSRHAAVVVLANSTGDVTQPGVRLLDEISTLAG
nr:serine hydrolase [Streptomyces sp. SID3343]